MLVRPSGPHSVPDQPTGARSDRTGVEGCASDFPTHSMSGTRQLRRKCRAMCAAGSSPTSGCPTKVNVTMPSEGIKRSWCCLIGHGVSPVASRCGLVRGANYGPAGWRLMSMPRNKATSGHAAAKATRTACRCLGDAPCDPQDGDWAVASGSAWRRRRALLVARGQASCGVWPGFEEGETWLQS
jgi:hypothetical protein